MFRYIFVSFLSLTLSSFAYALTEADAKIVSESVLELCRGGSLTGHDSSVQIKGEGKVTTVLFKKLAEAGLSGEAEFSKAEWDGIRPFLPDKFDSDAYVKCVIELTPKFLDKFSSSGLPISVNLVGKWVYENSPHYWVVRPGSSTDYSIEVYTSENDLVGEGTANVKDGIVSFTIYSGGHHIGDTYHMWPKEENGRLEYQENKLSGQTDALTLESLTDPADIVTLTLNRTK